MNCPKCNTQNSAESRFCANCGGGLAAVPVDPQGQPGYSTMRRGPQEREMELNPRRDDSTGRVLAIFTPLGQFYNGEIWKGILIVVLYLVELGMVVSFFGTLIGLIAIVATWIWAFTDARKVQRGLKEPW